MGSKKSSKTFGTCLGGLKSPAVALEGKEVVSRLLMDLEEKFGAKLR